MPANGGTSEVDTLLAEAEAGDKKPPELIEEIHAAAALKLLLEETAIANLRHR